METEMTVNQTIEIFLKSKKMTQQEFAIQMGVTKQTINNWVTGAVQIPVKHIIAILNQFPELNARWLLTGEGEMGDVEKPTTGESKNCLKIEAKNELLLKQLQEKELLIAELYKQIGKLEAEV